MNVEKFFRNMQREKTDDYGENFPGNVGWLSAYLVIGLGAGGDVDVWLHGFVIGLGVSTHHQANTGTFHLFCQLSQRTHTD